jgi:hypothetical protein
MSENAAGPFPTRPFAQAVADSGDDPPDKMRSPAAGNGRANRKSSKPGRLKKNEYADGVRVSRVSVRNDPALLACWYSVTPDSLVIGTFGTRLEAAQASVRRP